MYERFNRQDLAAGLVELRLGALAAGELNRMISTEPTSKSAAEAAGQIVVDQEAEQQ